MKWVPVKILIIIKVKRKKGILTQYRLAFFRFIIISSIVHIIHLFIVHNHEYPRRTISDELTININPLLITLQIIINLVIL